PNVQYWGSHTSWGNKAREGNKGIHKEKEEIKLSLFPDDMILYVRDPKNYPRNPLEMIKNFSKVA
ncbi:hypothetical protein ACQP3L_40480, partial [Escherichia coli]